MFRYFKKVIKYTKAINKTVKTNENEKNTSIPIDSNIRTNLTKLKDILGNSNDIITKRFKFGHEDEAQGALVFIEGLINKDTLNRSVLKPLMYDNHFASKSNASHQWSIDQINQRLLSTCHTKKIAYLNHLLSELLSGNTIFLLENSKEALVIHSKEWEKRNIEEPLTENVVRGPREGFTETMRTNISLLRRKIKSPDLRIDSFTIGERTKTDVAVVYIKDVANPKLIEEIKIRLDRIHIDAILESGYIEALIEDAPYSIFATVGNSEKPDVVAGKILEGRAALFVDGTPFVLTVPLLFVENFQTAEDYYSRPYYSSAIRSLRFLSYLISILAPGAYVALTTFHQELIPTQLLFTMAAGHYGVPLPAVVEAGIMLIIFDILREAGIRLPKPVGSAISIVGALVLGESAVSAGLISPFMVIIVSLTAIAGFVVPAQTDSSSILRYTLLVSAGFLGAFGIITGLLVVLIHLASLRSFGTPYLSPIAPFTLKGMKDVYVRLPIWTMLTRPKLIGWFNSKRQTESKMAPAPPNRKKN